MRKFRFMLRILGGALFGLILSACPPSPWSGDIVYVKPEAFLDAGGDGSSPQKAVSSLTRALAGARSGNVFVLLPGIYKEAINIELKDYGPDGISIRADSPGSVSLEGSGTKKQGFFLAGVQNLRIEGIEFRDYRESGMTLIYSQDICLEGNLFEDNGADSPSGEGYGINAGYSRSISIIGNRVLRNGPGPGKVAQGFLGTGINTYALYDSLIQDNICEANIGGGILVEDGARVLVEGNSSTAHRSEAPLSDGGSWWCGGIWLDGGREIRLLDNVFSDNRAGIYLSNLDAQDINSWSIEGNRLEGNQSGFFLNAFGPGPGPEDLAQLSGNTLSANAEDVGRIDSVYWSIQDASVSASHELGGQRVKAQGKTVDISGNWQLSCRVDLESGLEGDRLEFRLPYAQSGGGLLEEGAALLCVVSQGHYYELWWDPASSSAPVQATEGSNSFTFSIPVELEIAQWGWLPDGAFIIPAGFSVVFSQ